MAVHGQHEWRAVPGADVAFLVSLPAVQRELATAADVEIGPDTELDAIVAAVGKAIDRLSQPYREAAVEQFGFSDLDPSMARKKGAREEAAATRLGTGARMYEMPTQRYGGISRRDYVIRLVAASLREHPQTQEIPVPSTESTRRLAPTQRILSTARVLAAVVMLALVGLGIWLLVRPHAAGTRVPPVGSVFDATTGRLYSRRPVPEPATPAYGALVPGNFLRLCDPALGRCPNPRQTPVAKPGDTITIRLLMTNRYIGPISWLKLLVSWEPAQNFLTANVTWPGGKQNGQVGDSVQLQLTDHAEHRLEYVRGSTALYAVSQGADGRRLVSLPDGIMSDGIELTNFGPPGKCADCIATYARVVTFQARISKETVD